MSIFGTLVSPWSVEQAAIATLGAWLPTYIAEVERQAGLGAGSVPRPPALASIHGGVDFLTWQGDLCPEVIVIVDPAGAPEHTGSIGYSQAYELRVGVIAIDDAEDVARQTAGVITAAAGAALLQQVGRGGLATRVTLATAPRVDLQNVHERGTAEGCVVLHALIDAIVNDQGGPVTPPQPDPNAPWSDWPPVRTPSVTVDAVSPSGD